MRSTRLLSHPDRLASSKFISYGAVVADLQRLADYVVARRTELGWSQETLAARSDLRTVTLSDIETAKDRERRPSTLAKLERALGWKPGSVRTVFSGGEPELADETPDPDAETDELMGELGRRRAALVAALQTIEAEIAAIDGERARNTRRVG